MRHSPRPVVLFTTHLGGGGAEKQLVRLANHLDRSRFRVTVVVARGGGAYEAELAPHVDLYALGADNIASAAAPLRRCLRAEPPALLFSIMDRANCAALLATRAWSEAPPVVLGVQIPLRIELWRNTSLGQRLLRLLIPRLYPLATHVVALSRGVADDLVTWIPGLRPRTSVVYNVGVDDNVRSRALEELRVPELYRGEGPTLVACGRLTEQKGFVHLLRALAAVRRHVPAKLWLLGDGPLRGALSAEARALAVADAVWFAGFKDNPYPYMRAADVFVLSSLWEGFGNVVAEAMAVGAPVVATDCPYGPGEIIRSPDEGVLVPPGDEAALAAAILALLGDEARRRDLSRNGVRRAEDFSAETVAHAYGEVFMRVLDGAPAGVAPAHMVT